MAGLEAQRAVVQDARGEDVSYKLVRRPEGATRMVPVAIPAEKCWQILPVLDTDLRERAASIAATLTGEAPIAVILVVSGR